MVDCLQLPQPDDVEKAKLEVMGGQVTTVCVREVRDGDWASPMTASACFAGSGLPKISPTVPLKYLSPGRRWGHRRALGG